MVWRIRWLVGALLIFFWSAGAGLMPGSVEAGDRIHPSGEYVRVEVTGVLDFEHGRGYVVRVRPNDSRGSDIVLGLALSENKVLVQALQRLQGRRVRVNGHLVTLNDRLAIEAEDADFGISASPE